MMRQLGAASRDAVEGDAEFPFRLVGRRESDALNSQGRDQPKLSADRPYNPVHLNPADMSRLGIEAGMLVAIASRRTTIYAFAKPSEDLRPGVVSISHCYGIDIEKLDARSLDGRPQPHAMGGTPGHS
jgi:anaerobic selenocysteine-containing dehydrogenase